MSIHWDKKAWDDYVDWQNDDKKIARKINSLVKEIHRHGRAGKAELLKGDFSGWASARINSEHRLVYKFSGEADNQTLFIAQCKNHYHDN
jgi:toxin YoeB